MTREPRHDPDGIPYGRHPGPGPRARARVSAETNVKGNYFTLQKALPLVRDGGAIVIMSAPGVRLGAPSYSVATATRGATMALSAS